MARTVPNMWSSIPISGPIDGAVSRFDTGVASLYFNAGRREKLSKGDIAGFLINKGGLAAGEIGKVIVHDHYALAAVPSARVHEIADKIRGEKIKGQRARITPVGVSRLSDRALR